jgi:hypothetical protein
VTRKATTPRRPDTTTTQSYECVGGCGTICDPHAPGTWREVTGWVEARKAGGSNAVRDPQGTGRYLCKFCMADRQKGLANQQGFGI